MLGSVSTCWSVGQPDADCPNNGLCINNGCANVCQGQRETGNRGMDDDHLLLQEEEEDVHREEEEDVHRGEEEDVHRGEEVEAADILEEVAVEEVR